MTDENNVVAQQVVDEQTTQTSSPQVEEAPSQPQTSEAPVATEVPDELPESVEEQRRAFQEMRRELKALKEAKEESVPQSEGSAFDAFRPQGNVVPQTVNPDAFTDPVTGMTDLGAYNNAVMANARAAAVQATQEAMDEQTARSKHPDLFADPTSERQIADLWFAAKMRGENVTVTQVADSFAQRFGKVVSKAEKAAAERVLTEVSAKEQASAGVPAQSGTVGQAAVSYEADDGLKERARFGDENALAELMARVPWAGR